MVGYLERGAAADVFAIDAASGDILAQQSVVALEQGGVEACWAMVLTVLWIGLGEGCGRMGCRPRGLPAC